MSGLEETLCMDYFVSLPRGSNEIRDLITQGGGLGSDVGPWRMGFEQTMGPNSDLPVITHYFIRMAGVTHEPPLTTELQAYGLKSTGCVRLNYPVSERLSSVLKPYCAYAGCRIVETSAMEGYVVTVSGPSYESVLACYKALREAPSTLPWQQNQPRM